VCVCVFVYVDVCVSAYEALVQLLAPCLIHAGYLQVNV
jgi:hypothetical protein